MQRELSLKEIQDFSLLVMDNIHEFCKNHNIKYSLAGGSLIGAIRHKGFIPWDDDIDIMMPRPDYDRFCIEYKSSAKFEFISPENSYLPFVRVCDCENSYVKPSAVWNKSHRKTGIWVDIFPLDGAIEDDCEYDERVKLLFSITDQVWTDRLYKDRSMEFKKLCREFIRRLFNKNRSIEESMKLYDSLCREIPYGSVERMASYTNPVYGKKDRHNIHCFDSLIDVDFEGRKYHSLVGYHEYLTNLFGDYMQLPPEEQRVQKHSQHKYYTK